MYVLRTLPVLDSISQRRTKTFLVRCTQLSLATLVLLLSSLLIVKGFWGWLSICGVALKSLAVSVESNRLARWAFVISVNLTARQSGFLDNRMSAAKFTRDIVTDSKLFGIGGVPNNLECVLCGNLSLRKE